MTISPCSSSSSTSGVQSQPPKNQAQSGSTTKQEPTQDTVQLSSQALNQLKGTDPDGDGH
jgi:anti-sigma28 factor (negative regulator of flagellin synthesis)